jgi:hypothetical protein
MRPDNSAFRFPLSAFIQNTQSTGSAHIGGVNSEIAPATGGWVNLVPAVHTSNLTESSHLSSGFD